MRYMTCITLVRIYFQYTSYGMYVMLRNAYLYTLYVHELGLHRDFSLYNCAVAVDVYYRINLCSYISDYISDYIELTLLLLDY